MTAIRPGKPEQGPFPSLNNEVLPASGAFTNQDYTPIPPTSRRLGIIAEYTKAAAGTNGQATFRVQWRVKGENGDTVDFYEVVIDGTDITIAAPYLRNPEYAYQVDGPVVAGTDPFRFRLLSLEVPILADGCRVLAAELGDTTHPGTLSVWLYTSVQI